MNALTEPITLAPAHRFDTHTVRNQAALSFGFNAFVFFLLRAQRVSLAEIDFCLRPGSLRARRTTLRHCLMRNMRRRCATGTARLPATRSIAIVGRARIVARRPVLLRPVSLRPVLLRSMRIRRRHDLRRFLRGLRETQLE